MGLLIILLKNLILFSLKLILFELIYGVVWAIFGFRVQEFGADLCYCLSIFFIERAKILEGARFNFS